MKVIIASIVEPTQILNDVDGIREERHGITYFDSRGETI